MRFGVSVIIFIIITFAAGCIQSSEQNASKNISQNETTMLNQEKRIAIEGAYSNLAVLRATGPAAINTSEIRVILGSSETLCRWSREVAEPYTIFTCELQQSCTGSIVTVIAPGNFEQRQC
ncbi:MAG: hypothetical protein HY514_01230 [Candidatus Aenigmarchaeota archaeon]|nr:hypothetical protein [Candidatus Aenigmarchaeota archaeon]